MAGNDARDLSKQLWKFLPFEGWEVVEIAFPARDTDVKVPHTLNPDDPYDVAYITLGVTGGPAIIYDQPDLIDSVAAVEWTKNYIVLRSSADEVVATILLVIKRRAGTPTRE